MRAFFRLGQPKLTCYQYLLFIRYLQALFIAAHSVFTLWPNLQNNGREFVHIAHAHHASGRVGF